MKAPQDTTILVVDDEVYMREILAFDLERRGYKVQHADGGIAAMKMLKEVDLDLVISDVRMPAGSGVDLLGWLKSWNPLAPSFIFMTAFADISADEALDKGAEAFLTKPLSRDHMLEEVEKALVRREERWARPHGLAGLRTIGGKQDEWESDATANQVVLGNGGAFVEMNSGFPDSLEIVAFDLLVDGQMPLEGQGRVRWVRHEESEIGPPGIGIEFLSLTDDSRNRYLAYLQKVKPRAYVPLGPS